nr:PREDICTED: cornifelin homolog A-like isoform X2 [Lepisosteus oculatus]
MGSTQRRSEVRMETYATTQQPLTAVTSDISPAWSGQWSTGLCDCCEDMGVCCCAFWCFPCFACKTTSEFGECLCLPVLDGIGCVPPVSLAMRAAVRERYGIQGNIYSDCFYGCCCYPLSWCQISREIKRRNQSLTFTNSHASTLTAGFLPLSNEKSEHLS